MSQTIHQVRAKLAARPATFLIIVLLAAICSNVGFISLLNPFTDLDADGPAWLSVAQNLANGRGFYNDNSPWKNVPESNLNPGWPLLVVPFLKLLPGLDPRLVIRIAAATLNVLAALMIARLTYRLSSDYVAGLFAGLFYALYPAALHLMFNGMGEISFVLVIALALLAFLKDRWYLGAALMGYACTIRHNALCILPYFLIVAYLHPRARAEIWRRTRVRTILACAALFCAPISLWVLRNYKITGHFPVISTQDGITWHGANNDIVANNVDYWGSSIWVDNLPGEPKYVEIAARMSPYEANQYHKRRTFEYFRSHWRSYPRLLLGRLVRAYVPVPWNPDWALAGAHAARLALFVLLIGTRSFWLPRTPGFYALFLSAIVMMSLTTTLLVFAQARYVFWFEVALIPSASIGAIGALTSRRRTDGVHHLAYAQS